MSAQPPGSFQVFFDNIRADDQSGAQDSQPLYGHQPEGIGSKDNRRLSRLETAQIENVPGDGRWLDQRSSLEVESLWDDECVFLRQLNVFGITARLPGADE